MMERRQEEDEEEDQEEEEGEEEEEEEEEEDPLYDLTRLRAAADIILQETSAFEDAERSWREERRRLVAENAEIRSLLE